MFFSFARFAMSSGAVLRSQKSQEGESTDDDGTRVTPVKRRRILNLVDLRGPGGMTSSSVELGGGSPCLPLSHTIGGLSASSSVGHGRRSRTPLTDLDSKFVTKSGLCGSLETGDGGSLRGSGIKITHLTSSAASGGFAGASGGGSSCRDDTVSRFPRLDQCAHFHYEYVELPPITIALVSEELKPLSQGVSVEDAENKSLLVQVTSMGRSWVVRRTYDNFRFLDKQLHRCCYDRKFSQLKELPPEENFPGEEKENAIETTLRAYLERLSDVAGSLITCGPVLSWLELDNRGHRLIVTDDSDINTPAVAAAYVIKRYTAQASDEISFEVGDMISVIDMPPPEESIWWRGKRGFQVGFFPCECVQVIGDKVPQAIHPQALTLPPTRSSCVQPLGLQHHPLQTSSSVSSTQEPLKPVLRKHGKLIAFFRSFILSRPSRRKLKQSGILRERVFGCDLAEHLLNSGHEIPMVLKCCSEFIESHGTVDGIYRLSGITSNIQKLRNAFDEERVPDLYGDESILQDIHCVSSVLKMYFRELPNPLLTYQLYDKFVAAVMQNEDVRLLHVRDVVQQLPPPHYRTLEYLIQHLARVASHSSNTGMTPRNIAIVWAPNLLRSKDLEKGGVAALQDVGTQAVVTEYLVRYVDLIFNDKIPIFSPSTNGTEGSPKKLRPKSLAISTPTKLLSIDEARNRALAAIKSDQKYIEVGGGPDSLPKTYHTVIDLPSRKGGSLKQKKSPLGWKTLFSKNKHQRKASTPNDISLNISDSVVTEGDLSCHITKRLRPVKSVESLVSTPASLNSNRNSQVVENANSESERSPLAAPRERKGSISSESSSVPSPRTHNRSVSHDSYFNLLEKKEEICSSTSTAVKEERESDGEMSPESSKIFLDISELNLEFNTSEAEMKIFSEDDTLKSTSIEDTLSRSTDDVGENISLGSDLTKSKENVNRCEKRSLKDKLKKRFTSPSSQRKETNFSDSSEDSRTNSLKRASSVIKEKLVQALSPETMRKRELSIALASPGGSPNAKLKKSEKIKEPACIDEVSAENSPVQKLESLSNQNSLEDKVTGDDIKERLSIESALIDPELLDKITRMRVSPSVSASEASSVSLAEATVSDNESFTLGSSNNTASNEVEGGLKDIYVSDSGTLPQSLITTPCTPPVTIVPDPHFEDEISKREIPQIKHSEKSSQNKGENVNKPVKPVKDRPNSLLGISLTDSTCIGSSLTSPETPQGDSTFLDIQYHPLSDTTEPSTPSESHFIGNIDEVTKETPRQSSPLSPDISSSSADEPPNENGPFYENIELTTSVSPSNFTNLEILSNKNLQEYNSKFSSEISTPTAQESELEYENIEYNVLEQSVYEEEDAKAFDSNSVTPCYENLQQSFVLEYEPVNQERSADTTYENVTPTEQRSQNEHLDENYYEDYVFNHSSEYENIEFSNFDTKNTKSEAEIDGEEVYQQVKFLRKSIQEVNKILNENSENALTPVPSLQPINIITCQTSLEERRRDERVDGEGNVDSECLDSPVTPSSSSLVTEVLVLPSFSSPTESTTEDAATSSEESESQSSPKGTHVQQPSSPNGESSTNSSSNSLNSFIPTLSPPSPDLTGVIPLAAASLVSSKNTLSPTNPSPWPRSSSKQGPIWPPVPKPRNLPAFTIGPVLSPTSTLSSPLDSPKFHIVSGEPTPEEIVEEPKTHTSHPKNVVHIVNMSCSKTEASPKVYDDASVVTNSAKIESKIEPDKVKVLSDNELLANLDTGPDVKEEDEAQKRERIEKYKQERRSFLREKYKSESFKGEKDDMLLRLKQKATSPSRQEEEEILLENRKGSGQSHSSKTGQAFQNSKPSDSGVSDQILVTCQRSNVPIVETFQIQSLPKSDNDCLFHRSICEDSRILVNKNKSESQQNVSSKSDSKCNVKTSDSVHQNRHDSKSKLDDDINVKERVAIWSRQENLHTNVTQKGDCKAAGSVSVKTTPPKSRKFQTSPTDFSSRKISVPTKCYTLPQASEKENTSEGNKIGGSLTFKSTKCDPHIQHPSTSPVDKIEKNPFSISKSENISVVDKKLLTSQEEQKKRPILLTQKSESDLREPITLKTRSYSVGGGLCSSTQSSSVSSNFRIGCQQQRRIKDMKALFEKDGNSQDVKKPIVIRQTSREGISN